MPGANVAASGLPAVMQCRLFQKSTAAPGNCVLRTRYSTSALSDLTTLTITAQDSAFSGSWPNMRIVKRSRVSRDVLYWVLQDSRWMLGQVFFSDNYNMRDELGRLDNNNQKTVAQLWALIASASGLPISLGSVPSVYPPAYWRGKRGDEVAQQLLDDTACVMTWNPVSATYVVSIAGSGTLPSLTNRTYSPGPTQSIANLHVDTSPVLYESDLDAEAVVKDTSGSMVSLSSILTPIDLFTGFSGVANLGDRSRYQQSALRLWRITGATYPEALTPDEMIFFDHRATAISHLADPNLTVAAHPAADTSDALTSVPNFQFLPFSGSHDGDQTLSLVEGSELFHSESAVIAVDASGVIQDSIKIHASYYVRDSDATMRRNRVTRNLGGATDRSVVVGWLKPIDSNLADKNTAASAWTADHNAIADALATRFGAHQQTASVATILGSGGSGQVGAVLYELKSGRRGEVRTTWAFNFIPEDWRVLRG